MEKFIQVTEHVRLVNYGKLQAGTLGIQDDSRTWGGFAGLDAGEDEPLENMQVVLLDVADIGKLIAALQEMRGYVAGQGETDGQA